MHKRPTKNLGIAAKTAESPATSTPQNEKKSAPVSDRDEASARAARVKSSIRKILLANPLFPRFYADVVISSAPNSYEARILARNYKKIVEHTNLAKANLDRASLDRASLDRASFEKTNRTNATLLHAVGTPLGTVQATREVYLHSIPADARAAVEKVEDLLNRPKLPRVPIAWGNGSLLIQ